mgnify:CR=1 FL=1|jgi:hypothetical protein
MTPRYRILAQSNESPFNWRVVGDSHHLSEAKDQARTENKLFHTVVQVRDLRGDLLVHAIA